MSEVITPEVLKRLATRAKEHEQLQKQKNLMALVDDWLASLDKAIDRWADLESRLASLDGTAKAGPKTIRALDEAENATEAGISVVVEKKSIKQLTEAIESDTKRLAEKTLHEWRTFLQAHPKPIIDPIAAKTLSHSDQQKISTAQVKVDNLHKSWDSVPTPERIEGFKMAILVLKGFAESLETELPDGLRDFLAGVESHAGFALAEVDNELLEVLRSKGLIDGYVVRRA